MLNLEYFGEALTHDKIVPGNTATGISANCYIYREHTFTCSGVDAGSIELIAGQWIVGQTSGARGCIVSYLLTAGAWGNANARVTVRVKSLSGTFNGIENLGVIDNLNAFVQTTVPMPAPSGYYMEGCECKAALVVVISNTALIAFDGSIPDQTSLVGVPMPANSSIPLRDINSIRDFKCIDYVASSASAVHVSLYF